MGIRPRRGARNGPVPPSRLRTQAPSSVQQPVGPQAVAGDRQFQPPRRAPAPLPGRAGKAPRPADARAVRLFPRRHRVVRGHGQVLPQDPRLGVHRPAQDGGGQVHHLQLLQHRLVPLRRLLAAGAQDLRRRALQREAARVLRARPQGGGARAAARPARGGRSGRAAQGAPVHDEPEHDRPHGPGPEGRGQGGCGQRRGVRDDVEGVQVDARRAVPAQRRAQHRGLDPLAVVAGSAGVRQEDEKGGQDVRPVHGERGGGAQRAAAARGGRVRDQGHGRQAASACRRSQPGGQAHQGQRESVHAGPRRRRHRERRSNRGVGHVRTPQESRGLRQGHRGAGPCHRPRPLGHGEGHRSPPVRRRHCEGDHAPAHGRASALAAAVARGHVRRRPRHPRGHARARQRVDHQPGPRAVGQARGVPAGALRREQDRRQGPGLRDAAVRVRPADVPRLQPRAEGDPGDPRQPAARVCVEAPGWHHQGGAEHGGGLRAVHAAQVPAPGRRRAQASGPPVHCCLMNNNTNWMDLYFGSVS